MWQQIVLKEYEKKYDDLEKKYDDLVLLLYGS